MKSKVARVCSLNVFCYTYTCIYLWWWLGSITWVSSSIPVHLYIEITRFYILSIFCYTYISANRGSMIPQPEYLLIYLHIYIWRWLQELLVVLFWPSCSFLSREKWAQKRSRLGGYVLAAEDQRPLGLLKYWHMGHGGQVGFQWYLSFETKSSNFQLVTLWT